MNIQKRVQQLLQKNSLDAFFISSAVNIRYLTGFYGASETEREVLLLLTSSGWHIFTFNLYEQEAKAVIKIHPHITTHFITAETTFSSLFTAIHSSTPFTTLGIEPHSLTYYEHEMITKALPSLVITAVSDGISALRIIKTQTEIEKIRAACKLTDECFDFIQTQVKKDVSEKTLAWKIEQFIREHGGELSFSPIVAFNENAAVPHHSSTLTSQLSAPSLILLDFGAKIDGYHADMTRMLFFGTPTDEWVKAYTILNNAQERALNYLQSTAEPSGQKADKQTRKIIEKDGYPLYPHSLGHGVGLEIHEFPRLSAYKDMTIKEGMVFSVEPGIYLPGHFGMRIEDLVLKTKTGIEILSKSSKEIISIM